MLVTALDDVNETSSPYHFSVIHCNSVALLKEVNIHVYFFDAAYTEESLV